MRHRGARILVGLVRNARAMNRMTAQLLSGHNLTLGQFSVLEVLYSKGPLRIGEVQELILSSTGTMPTIVGNLERRHLITKEPDPRDRRAMQLHLTPEGEQAVLDVLPRNLEQLDCHCARLSDDEQEELICLLKKLGGK